MNAGAAQVDITPQPGVELSGFAARTQPSVGVLDSLYARGLYVEDGGSRLLWLHADLIALEREFVLDLRRRIRQEFGLASSQVMVSATHTHSGPATIHLQEAGTYDADYVQSLREPLIETARSAVANAEPCDLAAAENRLDLAIDRRRSDRQVARPPDAPLHVGALGFRRDDGTFVAALVNYPMHAVALGPANRQISADVPGQAAATLSALLPGNPVVLVTNGACGNLNPPAENVPFAQVQAWGRQVADAILAPLLNARPMKRPPIRTAARIVPLPLDTLSADEIDAYASRVLTDAASLAEWGDKFRRAVENWRQTMAAAVRRGQAVRHGDAELFAVRFGRVVMIGLNAEVFSEFADRLRARAGRTVYVVGYANGDLGYIPTEAAYAEGGYEVEVAHLFYGGFRPRADAMKMLVDEAVRLVRELSA